jgi:ketosteroid isomerase-like protein
MRPTAFPTPQDAEQAFYEALQRCDLEAMMAVWAEDEEIVCIHPGGPRLTGLRAVRESWREIFSGGPSLRVQVNNIVATQAMLVAVHNVQENFSIAGNPKAVAPALATNVYLKTAAGWRMIVHHASPASDSGQTRGSTHEKPQVLH